MTDGDSDVTDLHRMRIPMLVSCLGKSYGKRLLRWLWKWIEGPAMGSCESVQNIIISTKKFPEREVLMDRCQFGGDYCSRVGKRSKCMYKRCSAPFTCLVKEGRNALSGSRLNQHPVKQWDRSCVDSIR